MGDRDTEDLRENLEIESGFLKGIVFHLDFMEGDCIPKANLLSMGRWTPLGENSGGAWGVAYF